MHLEFSIIFLILYNSATTVATIIQKLFNHWFGSHRKYDHLWPAIAFIYCFLLIPSILILVAITKKLIYRNKIRICNNCLIRFLNCNRKYRNIVISKTYFAEELSASRHVKFELMVFQEFRLEGQIVILKVNIEIDIYCNNLIIILLLQFCYNLYI